MTKKRNNNTKTEFHLWIGHGPCQNQRASIIAGKQQYLSYNKMKILLRMKVNNRPFFVHIIFTAQSKFLLTQKKKIIQSNNYLCFGFILAKNVRIESRFHFRQHTLLFNSKIVSIFWIIFMLMCWSRPYQINIPKRAKSFPIVFNVLTMVNGNCMILWCAKFIGSVYFVQIVT